MHSSALLDLDVNGPKEFEDLLRTIRTLDARIWHQQLSGPEIVSWAEQFSGRSTSVEHERHLATALLSRFTFFGVDEVRVLLTCLYRDVYRHILAEQYRQDAGATTDRHALQAFLDAELTATRFTGAGNIAESGAHILYYFRQGNNLPISLFCPIEGLLADPDQLNDVRNIVLIDDVCGSGQSALRFGKAVIPTLRTWAADRSLPLKTYYLTVCGTELGIEKVRDSRFYDVTETVLILDSSHRVFDEISRYFPDDQGAPVLTHVGKDIAKAVLTLYGSVLYPAHPLGHDDGQLLLGFAHNIPNNTLPVFWSEREWSSIFRRYSKRYG